MVQRLVHRVLLTASLVVLLATSCTGDGTPEGDGSSVTSTRATAASTEPPSPSSSGPSPSVPPTEPGSASFTYAGSGIAATLVLRGERGTLIVRNESGHQVGAPSVYALVASNGERVDATVSAARPIEDQGDERCDVRFPSGFDAQEIGIVVLVLGDQDYGAFIPARGGGSGTS